MFTEVLQTERRFHFQQHDLWRMMLFKALLAGESNVLVIMRVKFSTLESAIPQRIEGDNSFPVSVPFCHLTAIWG